MQEERLKTAQRIISIMDKLLKGNEMSLVVRNGKAAVLDHDLDKVYKIDIAVDDEILKHLVFGEG